jgi:hypothetical protein
MKGFFLCTFVGMALKVGNKWKEHGWWIKVDALKSLCCGSRLTRWWKEGIGLLWGKALEKFRLSHHQDLMMSSSLCLRKRLLH